MSAAWHPLKVEPLVDLDLELLGVWSKGHHPAGAIWAADPFLEAARKLLATDRGYDPEELDELDPQMVCLETWRCVPHKVDGEWASMFVAATPGRPGAFPVTVLRFDP